jgi:hypothetical protein
MAYPTASDAITYCGITDTDHASMVADWVNWAIQIVETTTGRVFDAASSDVETRYFNGEIDVDGQTLWLDKDLLSVSVDTDAKPVIDTGTTDVILSTSDIVYLPPNDTPKYAIKILGSSGKWWGYSYDADNAISVKGIWGYSSTPPNDIWYAILRLVKWIFNSRVQSGDLDRPLLTNDGVTIMPAKLPGDVLAILMQYKKPKMGVPY